MTHIFRLTAFIMVVLTLVSCKGKASGGNEELRAGLPDTTIVALYMLGVNGNYEAYTQAMQSCDSTTVAYRQQIMLALKHRNDCVKKQKNGVTSVKVEHIELHDSDHMANAFLSVSYGDGTKEEVIFPLVRDNNGRWRIQ